MKTTTSHSPFSSFVSLFFNTIGTNFSIALINLFVTIILSRILGPDGRGIYTLIILLPSLIMTFTRLGVGHSINYYASKVSRNDIIFNSIFLSISFGLVTLLLSFILIPIFKPIFFKEIDINYLYFSCLLLPFLFFFDTVPSLLQGFYRIKQRNLIFLSLSVTSLILIYLFVVLLDYGIWGAIISYFTSHVLIAIYALFLVSKEIEPEKMRFNMSLNRMLILYGIKAHIGNVFKQLSYRGDILIVSYFLEAKWVGYYIVAVNIAEILWKLPEAIGVVLLPKIAMEAKEQVKSITPIVFRTLMYPMFMGVVGVLIFGKLIILLFYGLDFAPSVSVLMIMLPGIFALSFWKIVANDLIAQGYPVKYSITSGISAVLMIILDFILIPIYGINGAALATSIAYVIATVYIINSYLKVTKISLSSLVVPKKLDFQIYKSYFKRFSVKFR